MPKTLFLGRTEAQIDEMIRHECGHLLVARVLKFKTGGIKLTSENAGADIDIHLSFNSMRSAISTGGAHGITISVKPADRPAFAAFPDTKPSAKAV